MRLAAVAIAAISGLLAGCSAATAGVQTVSNVRAGTNAYSAWTMAKDMRNAKPLFTGYDGAVGLADIQPRSDGTAISSAFADNVVYVITQSATAVKAPVQVCPDMGSCAGRKILVVGFREKAPDNVLQRLAAGDKVRGVLDFTDAQTGQVVAEQRIEDAGNYAAVLKIISGAVGFSMLKSYPGKSADDMNAAASRLNGLDPIKPDYKTLFASS